MMCKCSKLTFSKLVEVSFRGVGNLVPCLLAFFLLVGLGNLWAQDFATPLPLAKPTPTPKPQAYVRFWNMLIGPKPQDLQLTTSEDRVLTAGSSANASAGYFALDPGTYTFTVRRPNDPAGIIKRMAVALRADLYITLLAAYGADGRPDVQIINDTVDPKTDDGLGKLVVRQFFPDANVTVAVNAQPSGTPLSFGEFTTLSGLPLRGSMVNLRATGLGPVPKMWNVDADFASGGHHATMLVFPDPYGRFRPRLVYDGASRKPLPPPAPPSTATGPTRAPTPRL